MRSTPEEDLDFFVAMDITMSYSFRVVEWPPAGAVSTGSRRACTGTPERKCSLLTDGAGPSIHIGAPKRRGASQASDTGASTHRRVEVNAKSI